MANQRLPRPVRGVVPPMITPLVDRDSIDEPGLERLIEHILAGGVHGLFVLGTTGEGPSLSRAARHKLVELACQQVADRVPVFVGVTDTSLSESVELSELAFEAGASAVVAASPFYYPMDQEELGRYFAILAAEAPLPVVLYNMPSCTKTALSVETVRACSEVENIVGLKDSSGDLEYLQRVRGAVSERPDFTLMVGPEELLAEAVRLGAHGGVSGGANLWPQLYVQLYEAAVAADRSRVAALQATVMRISGTIYRVGRHGSRIIQGIKTSLAVLGICSDQAAEPFVPLDDSERERIRRLVDELQVPRPAARGAQVR